MAVMKERMIAQHALSARRKEASIPPMIPDQIRIINSRCLFLDRAQTVDPNVHSC